MESKWNTIPNVVLLKIYSKLSQQDRLNAASTCKSWRECVYQISVWPCTELCLDLIKLNEHYSYSCYRFNEHKSNQFNSNNNYHGNYNQDNENAKIKKSKKASMSLFIQRVGRFVSSLDIRFNGNSFTQVKQLIEIILLFSSNTQNGNCRLRSFSLKPNAAQFLSSYESHKEKMLASLINAIELLFECSSIVNISFGCLEELLNTVPSLFSSIVIKSADPKAKSDGNEGESSKNIEKDNVNQLRSLHLATVKEDPDYYPVYDIPVIIFKSLKNLRVISIDYDYVSDEFLNTLSNSCSHLKKLLINVHGIDDQHPGLTNQSWLNLKNHINKPEVTINLLHSDDSSQIIKDMILDTDIPLTHFRSFFAGQSVNIVDLMNIIATRHQNTLRSLTIVTDFEHNTLLPKTTFYNNAENELVMLAWRCKKLDHLTVIGFEISEVDLIAITRLRGSQLRELIIPASCISLINSTMIEDEGYYDDDKFYLDMAHFDLRNQVIADIAKPLSSDWSPIFSSHKTASHSYLEILLEDHIW